MSCIYITGFKFLINSLLIIVLIWQYRVVRLNNASIISHLIHNMSEGLDFLFVGLVWLFVLVCFKKSSSSRWKTWLVISTTGGITIWWQSFSFIFCNVLKHTDHRCTCLGTASSLIGISTSHYSLKANVTWKLYSEKKMEIKSKFYIAIH